MLLLPVQAVGFSVVAARGSARLTSETELFELPATRRALTSIVRLPEPLAGALVGVASAVRGIAGHYLYPAGDLHLTLLNLDSARQPDDSSLVAAVTAALERSGPFPLAVRGLAISRSTIYARGYDPTGALLRARLRVSRATGCRPPWPLVMLGFVNVARFTRPLSAELVAGVAAARHALAGSLRVSTVEVVRTDRILSRRGTEVVERVRLDA